MTTIYATPKKLPKGHYEFAKLVLNEYGKLIAAAFDISVDKLLQQDTAKLTTNRLWDVTLINYADVEQYCDIITKDSHPEYFI